MSVSKEEKKKECTLDSIKSDYDQYGYLEDYQVEWLINELFDTRHLLFNVVEKNKYIGNGIHQIEITKELLNGIKNKLKK